MDSTLLRNLHTALLEQTSFMISVPVNEESDQKAIAEWLRQQTIAPTIFTYTANRTGMYVNIGISDKEKPKLKQALDDAITALSPEENSEAAPEISRQLITIPVWYWLTRGRTINNDASLNDCAQMLGQAIDSKNVNAIRQHYSDLIQIVIDQVASLDDLKEAEQKISDAISHIGRKFPDPGERKELYDWIEAMYMDAKKVIGAKHSPSSPHTFRR